MTRRSIGTFIIILIVLMLIIGCTKVNRDPEAWEREQDSFNNFVVERCIQYRTSEHRTQQEIRDQLQARARSYNGRIDRDAEYCLNSMEVPR